ncbi:hypothetical protein HDU87_004221 [Geranomyces variabilis]|uniref:AAA+ ATPase domain-containing protein n=1 Tax=Geranomyces variabilis TaxID=109894 RepID=A0AAD5TPB5_9FUNG|nr:hypothetical protein HDU87_004221 [Geranomyces variabilis]
MDIDTSRVSVGFDVPSDHITLTADLAERSHLRQGQLCEVQITPVRGHVCTALLRVAFLDTSSAQLSTLDGSVGGTIDSQAHEVLIPGWLRKLCAVAADVSTFTVPGSLRLAPAAVPSTMPCASRLMIRKIGDEPWVPTTVGLDRVRANNAKQSPMDFFDFPGSIAKGLPQTSKVNTFLAVPLLGRDAIFRIDRMENEDGTAVDMASVVPTKCSIVLGTPISYDELISGDLPPKLGGLKAEADELAGLIETAFYHGLAHDQLGIAAIRAILVSGPSGVGKSFLIEQVVRRRLRVPYFTCRVAEIAAANKYAQRNRLTSAEFVNPLVRCVEKAKLTAPAVVILDLELLEEDYKTQDLDCAARASEITAQISQLDSSSGVCVIATASHLQKLPAVFRKKADGGGFDRVVDISVPNREQRDLILRDLLQNLSLAQDPELLDGHTKTVVDAFAFRISQHTAGFVAHNLQYLVSQATRHAMSRHSRKASTGAVDKLTTGLTSLSVSATPGHSPSVTWREDFAYAFTIVGPAQVGFESTKPDVRWESMGGYEDLKTKVQQLSTWPSQRPETYMKLGVSPPAGLLLYGPSGCGKTLIVHALAATSPMNYISVKGSEIYSKYLGDSENMVRKLFAAARRLAPCLLFLDELDAIGTRREWSDDGGSGVNERVLSTLLNEMDGVQERKGVFVIACTMRPDKIDDALLRPGRLDHHLYVALPTVKDRRAILETLRRGPAGDDIFDSDVDVERLASLTDDFTGADLSVLIRESGIQALRASATASKISWSHIQAALDGAIRNTKGGPDPFESLIPLELDDAEEGQEDLAESVGKRKWWRPAWVDKEQIAGYEKFKLGREK